MLNSLNLSMSLISTGGFIPTNSLSNIIQTNAQKIIFIISLIISMLNFFLIFNFFKKRIFIREHREDIYLIVLSFVLILLVYLNNFSGLDIIISVLSSLSNSGLSLINSDNNFNKIWKWSVDNPNFFWKSIWDFTKVKGKLGNVVLKKSNIFFKNKFFPNTKLNYEENLLKCQKKKIWVPMESMPPRPSILGLQSAPMLRSPELQKFQELLDKEFP